MPAVRKRAPKVVVPKKRTISGKLTPFAPPRAAELYTLKSFDHVFDSVSFWMKQLRALSCPQCGVVGTLSVSILQSGLDVFCSRVEKCDFAREAQFFGEAHG